jgi:hypothetical protein
MLRKCTIENSSLNSESKLTEQLRTKGEENKRFPPLCKDGIPIEENINIMKAAILERLEATAKTEEYP